MTGRVEVSRLRQQLDATFARARTVRDDVELQSDLARYLCVLISGFLEQAVVELLLEHTRRRAAPSVQRHVESQLRRFTSAKAQRLVELLGSFDAEWRMNLETFLVDERKDAVDSIVDLRNSIAHGRSVGVTISRVSNYYREIEAVVEQVADLCDPARQPR
ncbi:MAG: HEPN domain-containing protein [Planctomycetota bacterium]